MFIFPSIWNASSLDYQFFSDFFHEVRHPKVRKVTDPGFWIKVQMGSRGTKSPHKMRFFKFQQNSYQRRYICFFALTGKFQRSFNFLQKQHVWETSGSWIMVQKPQGQSECSSNINEVIRPVLNFLFFFTIRFHKYKKAFFYQYRLKVDLVL